MSPVEAVARAICKLKGKRPDDVSKLTKQPVWSFYSSEARAAIEAIAANVTDEMTRALNEVFRETVEQGNSDDVAARRAIAAAIRTALTAPPTRNEPDPSQ